MKYILTLIMGCTIMFTAQAQDTTTFESGLKKVILEKGDGGASPVKNSNVKMKYVAKYAEGKEYQNGTIKFTLGIKEVLPGWDEGVATMTKGEKAYFYIPANSAYGAKGQEDPYEDGVYIVPPNSDLIFEMELVSFK